MKIKSVRFVRKFNLGNFENQDIDLTAEIEEGETVDQVIQALKKKALEHSGKE